MKNVIDALKRHWFLILAAFSITTTLTTVIVTQKVLIEDMAIIKPQVQSSVISIAEIKMMLEMMNRRHVSTIDNPLQVSF